MLGFLNIETSKRVLRGIRTVFFLITLIISFLVFSAPILVAIADALVPAALFSASISSPEDDRSFFLYLFKTLSFQFSSYDFRSSLIDIPLVSILRSGIILCVYGLCDGPGLSTGPYLGITTVCSVLSVLFVSVKASCVFGGGGAVVGAAELALFVWSPVLAIGHLVVAYRTSCRERRKLLVYKIDIEAVKNTTVHREAYAPSPEILVPVEATPPKPIVTATEAAASPDVSLAHRISVPGAKRYFQPETKSESLTQSRPPETKSESIVLPRRPENKSESIVQPRPPETISESINQTETYSESVTQPREEHVSTATRSELLFPKIKIQDVSLATKSIGKDFAQVDDKIIDCSVTESDFAFF